ncbi:HEAT repeat domain-containing protein [Listeria booriae]|uniref:HEAT repeat domain-containing protein n=1 Tax=Listeria booriae TaxID=1552123 RepID=UPI0016283767|nr:HEAT repeat domain-containing protein [Listeria booriae]MBC2098707.1 HEAT repeat domain-containing protein [Listeria booriae]
MSSNKDKYNGLINQAKTTSDPDELSNILEELKECPSNKQVESLYESYVDHENQLVRCIAFEGLGKSENLSNEVYRKAIEHLHDEVLVVMSCIELLSNSNSEGSVSSIAELLTHPDANVRCVAAEALGNMNSPEALPDIMRIYQAEMDELAKVGQTYAIYMLCDSSEENQAVADMADLLYANNETAAYRAMNNLIAILDDINENMIYKAFKDKSNSVASEAFLKELRGNIKTYFE